jgi:4Fe-4S ferredoxin
MSTRGKTIKFETPERQTLVRPMITRRYELVADRATCVGCKICELVCPREAITLRAPQVVDGRTVVSPKADVDADKCSFCGECVALCPTHALSMTVNGQPEIPVIKGEAFPLLMRTMRVQQAAFAETTDVAYIDSCPVSAISASVQRDAAGQVTAVADVEVARSKCVNCTHCMETGPKGAFTVTKPYKGRTFLNSALCPAGCQACADVCPTNCISYDGEKVSLDARFCLFCGACENVCPVPGAVRIARTGFVHTPVNSSAWGLALEKLVSYREYAREVDIKGQDKRRKLVLAGLHMEKDQES